MVELIENFKDFFMNPTVILIGAVTLIEVTPIKINPWRWILSWIGNVVNGEDRKNIHEINKNLAALKKEFEVNKAQEKRWHILDFVNSCRNGRRHTREEWNHAITELREYEEYTKNNNIPNGVIEEDGKYLRDLFHEHNRNNDFL